MADWTNMEKYIMFAFSIVLLILFIMLIVYWINKSKEHNKLIFIPNPPNLVTGPPNILNQPFFGLGQNKPNNVVNNALNNVNNNVNKPRLHGKARRSSSSSDSGSGRMQIEVYLWGASYCPHSTRFKSVWRNVQRRLRKLRMKNVSLRFRERACDGHHRNDFEQQLVDGNRITSFPTVSACVKGQAHDLITNGAIHEEELEQRLQQYINMRRQQQ